MRTTSGSKRCGHEGTVTRDEPGLARMAAAQTRALGGTYASVGGRDVMTFVLEQVR